MNYNNGNVSFYAVKSRKKVFYMEKKEVKSKVMSEKGIYVLAVLIVILQVVLLVMITRFSQTADFADTFRKFIPFLFLGLCLMADVIMVMSIVQMKKRKRSEQENEMLNSELENQLQHYDQIISHLEKMSVFRHDFRNYMQTVYLLIDRGEYKEAAEMLDVLGERVKKSTL